MNVDVIDATAEALPLELLNAKNKELTAHLSRSEQLYDEKTREVEDQRRRLQFVKEHLSNVRGEIVSTQSLSECKRREVESELHMFRLLDRECGRLRQGTTQLTTRQAELQDQLQAAQNRFFQENLRMEELRHALTVNQDELEQWDLARKQKEADEAAVARYTKSDEANTRQLDFALKRLETQLRERRRDLSDAVAVARGVQGELDRVAADYRRLHDDRGNLLAEWEEVVRTIHARDEAIRAAAEQYTAGAEWIERRRADLRDCSAELDEARGATVALNTGIHDAEKRAERGRTAHAELTRHVATMEEEVEALREQHTRGVRDRNAGRLRLEQSRARLEGQKAALERTHAKRLATREAVHAACDDTTDMAAQRATIDAMLRDARAADRNVDKEVEELKREQFRAGEQLHTIMAKQDEHIADITGGQAQAKNMRVKIGQLDRESFLQQEILYNIEFNVQQMQRKVSRVKGERTEEERIRLQERIAALNTTLSDVNAQHNALAIQVKRVREETRLANLDVSRLESQRRVASDHTLQLRLECDSCAAEMRRLASEREEALVLADTQELQLQRLHRAMLAGEGAVADLAAQRERLALDVAEREAEAGVHRDMLRLEHKVAAEERRRLAAELQERRRAFRALIGRYDVLVGRMDPEQARLTQAQLVIESAKEREGLQHKGDALDARVRRLEHETAKLERALAVVRASNSNYRHLFDRVGESHDEARTRRALFDRRRDLKALLSRRTVEAAEYEHMRQMRSQELETTKATRDQRAAAAQALRDEFAQAHAVILESREAEIRFDQAITRTRAAVPPEVAADIELCERRRRIDLVVQHALRSAHAQSSEIYEAMKSLLIERRISIDSTPAM